jgi:hypothetical protein
MAPDRNRMTPMGDIEAIALRGAWTGNRGILDSGHEIVRINPPPRWCAEVHSCSELARSVRF